MGWLTFGYFISYIPYAMLVKALASGVTPLSSQQVSGYEMLPAAVLGQLVAMVFLLALTGRWRHLRRRETGGHRIPVAGRETLAAGFFTSLIVGATTMNYTFSGVSILFMLLLMRGGVLILSPLIDAARKRRVMKNSWAGLCLSLLAVSVALADVHSPTPLPAHPMAPGARSALAGLGLRRVPGRGNPRRHRARPITSELCRVSSVFYCMTRAHRDRVSALAPEAASRTVRLDPHGDIPDPHGQSPEAYRRCAQHLQRAVRLRLGELTAVHVPLPSTGRG
ncbi:hypothetical protein ACJ6WF_09440 [Streptomyces sp. MMS24-I2-30]|uniref:arsenate reductase/protein-tyrosine-phosphatase family protein n=1 Tax=Streptomyces sp. MMS24-I2-30 TaxID=3351564 RepID=UPI003896AD68